MCKKEDGAGEKEENRKAQLRGTARKKTPGEPAMAGKDCYFRDLKKRNTFRKERGREDGEGWGRKGEQPPPPVWARTGRGLDRHQKKTHSRKEKGLVLTVGRVLFVPGRKERILYSRKEKRGLMILEKKEHLLLYKKRLPFRDSREKVVDAKRGKAVPNQTTTCSVHHHAKKSHLHLLPRKTKPAGEGEKARDKISQGKKGPALKGGSLSTTRGIGLQGGEGGRSFLSTS